MTDLINLSQVVLALQLPLAMFPLLHFTSSRRRMGRWRSGWFLLTAGWVSAVVITAMDVWGAARLAPPGVGPSSAGDYGSGRGAAGGEHVKDGRRRVRFDKPTRDPGCQRHRLGPALER